MLAWFFNPGRWNLVKVLQNKNCISSVAHGMKWYTLTVNKVSMRSSTAHLRWAFSQQWEKLALKAWCQAAVKAPLWENTQNFLSESPSWQKTSFARKLNYKDDPMWSQYGIVVSTHATAVNNLLQVCFRSKNTLLKVGKNIKIKVTHTTLTIFNVC